jgi:DNA-binding NarL/FixJ family response regulator
VSIFEQPAAETHAQLLPVAGSMKELLAMESLKYLVVDLHSSGSGLKSLDTIRHARPEIKMIVIGPGGNDELIMKAIVSGARAYLDQKAGPGSVRKAIEVVTEGSIWAPRRLLSQLIDRLLDSSEADGVLSISPTAKPEPAAPQLTARERQVLELIMKAHSNREIASKLGIEERTVRAHLARLMRKAGVDNRIKLSITARRLFLLPQKSANRPSGIERGRPLITK